MKYPTFDEKTAINIEFKRLYDASIVTGRHGFYETAFGAMHKAYEQYLDGTLELPKPYTKADLEAMRYKGN